MRCLFQGGTPQVSTHGQRGPLSRPTPKHIMFGRWLGIGFDHPEAPRPQTCIPET